MSTTNPNEGLPKPLFIPDDPGDGDSSHQDTEAEGVASQGENETYFNNADEEWLTTLDLPLTPKVAELYKKTDIMRSVHAKDLTHLAGILKSAEHDGGFEAVINVLVSISDYARGQMDSDFASIGARDVLKQLSNLQKIASRSFTLNLQYPEKIGLTEIFVSRINENGGGWLVAESTGDEIEVRILTYSEMQKEESA